ncbi:MAG: hypothetical protein CMF41_04000 [Legionellales bacterium]|nr:hypothetical protein [Legionellales bacterium]|tara:strand:+ start:1062 stop:1571 length:510 start_codon:yes stop_codon:yes gene_type:complete
MNHQQIKNVITYYLMNMLKSDISANHITRDVIEFNKLRGKYCGMWYKKYNIFEDIHNAKHITQINSVPDGSLCCIDNKRIPCCSHGVQLIINGENSVKHFLIQKKYQTICYNYFKIRNFDTIIQDKIKKWFLNEPWYFPKTFPSNVLLKHLLESNFCDIIYTEVNEILE